MVGKKKKTMEHEKKKRLGRKLRDEGNTNLLKFTVQAAIMISHAVC